MSVEVRDLSFSYGGADVLRNVSFRAGEGERIAVLGPNGVGKSTFFGCLLGFLKPHTGAVVINGRDVKTLAPAALAREIAYIPQSAPQTYNYTVLDLVLMGMTGQLGVFSAPKAEHKEKALSALESLGAARLASRGSATLSGGERQLALLARALVQDAKILIMDEPTANLDYGNSFKVMRRIRALGEAGYTVIFSTHDPNQAFRCATRVLAFRGGGVRADGSPDAVLTEDLLSELYGTPVAVRAVTVQNERLHVSMPYERRAGQ